MVVHDELDDVRLRLIAPRYSAAPFPAYRFTPGRDPHPTANPKGHSYEPPGHSPAPIRFVPSEKWRDSEAYLHGCDLYNHGYWWEAHEAWEGLWKVVPADSPQKHFLQGIIQVSACHLKLFLGHMDGVARLRASSREHFMSASREGTTRPLMGVDLTQWLKSVEGYYDRITVPNDRHPHHDPATYPYMMPT